VGAVLADAVAEGAVEAAARDLDILGQRLSKSAYLAGDTVSLADLFFVPMVELAANKGSRFASGKRAALGRWLASMTSRKSFESTAS
jgi:glutathione S-transferase